MDGEEAGVAEDREAVEEAMAVAPAEAMAAAMAVEEARGRGVLRLPS